jgi:hypothetical protein
MAMAAVILSSNPRRLELRAAMQSDLAGTVPARADFEPNPFSFTQR